MILWLKSLCQPTMKHEYKITFRIIKLRIIPTRGMCYHMLVLRGYSFFEKHFVYLCEVDGFI